MPAERLIWKGLTAAARARKNALSVALARPLRGEEGREGESTCAGRRSAGAPERSVLELERPRGNNLLEICTSLRISMISAGYQRENKRILRKN